MPENVNLQFANDTKYIITVWHQTMLTGTWYDSWSFLRNVWWNSCELFFRHYHSFLSEVIMFLTTFWLKCQIHKSWKLNKICGIFANHSGYSKMALCHGHILHITGPLWGKSTCHLALFNTLRPRQNGRHFPDDIFKWIFLNENVWISISISLKFVPRGPINNISMLVQVMDWRRSGDKPLSEPMMVSLPTHICVTRPQWVKNDK